MLNRIKAAAVAVLFAAGLALAGMAPVQAGNIALDGDLIVSSACAVTGATPQTCNGRRGIVTTGTLTTAAATNAAYVINNTAVAATSHVICNIGAYSGTLVTNGYPIFLGCTPGAGTITVQITNTHAANALNGTVTIQFMVLQ